MRSLITTVDLLESTFLKSLMLRTQEMQSMLALITIRKMADFKVLNKKFENI